MNACIKLGLCVTIALASAEIFAATPQGAIEVADYNSDGIDDYLLIDPELARARNEPYFVFLSDKTTGQHKKIELSVCNPKWDAAKKTLTSGTFDWGNYTLETYEFHGNSPKLIMTVKRIVRDDESDPGNLKATTTTRRLVAGKWVETFVNQ